MTYLLFIRIAGSFRVSLFIDFGGAWNFGTCWRGTCGTFMNLWQVGLISPTMIGWNLEFGMG